MYIYEISVYNIILHTLREKFYLCQDSELLWKLVPKKNNKIYLLLNYVINTLLIKTNSYLWVASYRDKGAFPKDASIIE